MTCQPVYAAVRQGTLPGPLAVPVTENQPRCACGWRGHWHRRWPDVYAELADHLKAERRPL